MRTDTERYLVCLCDYLTDDGECLADLRDAGVEPFSWGAALHFSPTRTKAIMRELLQHHLLDIQVAVGHDERNELRMTWNRETERWYARTLRYRRLHRTTTSFVVHG